MLRCYRADLHIHTCLSPCADLTMSPKRIVEKAEEMKLDIIAVCDHNSAENVRATINAAKGKDLAVLAGMEVTSSEEVHVIALFDTAEAVLTLQDLVYKALLPSENDEKLFGQQIIVNEFDEVEAYNNRLLISATTLRLAEIVKQIHSNDGLVIASHIDRETYSILGQLGFIPDDLNIDGLEISPHTTPAQANIKFPATLQYPLVTSSDAHFLEDIGKVTTSFLLAQPTLSEIKMAFLKRNGRSIIMEA
jgi:predicted metal-dependent phosphoesterase TrpH